MTRVAAHFDSSRNVIVPDEPVDLGPDEKIVLHIEKVAQLPAVALPPSRPGISGAEFLRLVETLKFSESDLDQFEKALEDCSKVDPDGW